MQCSLSSLHGAHLAHLQGGGAAAAPYQERRVTHATVFPPRFCQLAREQWTAMSVRPPTNCEYTTHEHLLLFAVV